MKNKIKELLSTRASEVLYYIWDPIGVNDAPEARDEYDSYIPKIVDAILNGKDIEAISKMLFDIETKSMELPGNPIKCREVSRLLTNWYSVLKK